MQGVYRAGHAGYSDERTIKGGVLIDIRSGKQLAVQSANDYLRRKMECLLEREADIEKGDSSVKKIAMKLKADIELIKQQLADGFIPKTIPKGKYVKAEVVANDNWEDVLKETYAVMQSSVIDMGDALAQYKLECEGVSGGSSFSANVQEWLGMSPSTASKLIAIADEELFRTAKNLPASYETLYQLTTLPEPVLKKAINDGDVNAGMTRKDVQALKPNKPAKPVIIDAEVVEDTGDEWLHGIIDVMKDVEPVYPDFNNYPDLNNYEAYEAVASHDPDKDVAIQCVRQLIESLESQCKDSAHSIQTASLALTLISEAMDLEHND